MSILNKLGNLVPRDLLAKGLDLVSDQWQKNSRIKWYHAALFYAGVSAVGYLTSRSSDAERDARDGYQAPHQPIWAPPGAVFGPVWSLNNLALTWALHRTLAKPGMWPHRTKMLWLQGGIWFIYGTFGVVYFQLKSPWLAYAWTQADAALATLCFRDSYNSDRKLAFAFVPLMAWTWYASTVALYQAVYNRDPLLHTPALLAPVPALDKELEPAIPLDLP